MIKIWLCFWKLVLGGQVESNDNICVCSLVCICVLTFSLVCCGLLNGVTNVCVFFMSRAALVMVWKSLGA